ncbi:Uncharacterised protein [Nocardia africana]|uniref:Uncharacterized protein n=1 Tax=Nocardia africana TaxID=134964 RepID=A0A378X0E6_9NOCA|nr:Uncharacterised protein [Nocardia africana]
MLRPGWAANAVHNDVHVRIWLGGRAFDYRTAAAAVDNIVRDWRRKRWCTLEVVLGTIDGRLPETRLPNERLFLGP